MPTVTLSGVQVTFDKLDKSNPTTVQNAADLAATSEFSPVRSVLLFDTSGITGPVTVSAATFTATGNAGDTNAVNDIDFLKLLTEPVIGQATWNSYSTGNSWASDSGFNATDAVLTPAFTINDFLIAAANTNTSAGLIALCQDWINNPGNNKGLLVKFVDDTVVSGAYVGFSSPTLEIVYTSGGAPAVSTVSSNSASEGSGVVHTVTLASAVSGSPAVYALALAGVTATGGGVDFASALTNSEFSDGVTISGGNITVPVAVSSFTVTVPTINDVIAEPAETYTLTVGGVSGTGTINASDAEYGVMATQITRHGNGRHASYGLQRGYT